MNILYKYCDQKGIVKILESLELKLPYISEVNDPLECLPFIYCPDDKPAIEARYLSASRRKNMPLSAGYKQKLNEQFEKGEIQKNLKDCLREHLFESRQKSFLLSVSQEARSTVMWAHYADKHKGAAIGIDFDKIFPKYGIKIRRVDYSEQRPKMNVLVDFENDEYYETLLTKSAEWTYEREFRVIFDDAYLLDLEQQSLACLKDFNGKQTWFLRLNPESIKKIVFGLYTEESLKLAIRELRERAELQHIQLYQAEESETYVLNLIGLDKTRKTNC